MDAILTFIGKGLIPQAEPVLVLANLSEARGLTIAKNKFGVHTEVLNNNELERLGLRQKCDVTAPRIQDFSYKWLDMFGRFHEIIEPSIRLPLQK